MSDNAGETGPTQLDTVWSGLVEDLPPSQRAWLAGSRPVTLHESTAIIAVADEFTRNQIEGRLRTRLEDALGNAFDRQVRIAVTVDPELGGLDRPASAAPYRGTGEYGGAVDAPPPGPGAPVLDVDDDQDDTSMKAYINLSTNPLDVPTPAPSHTDRPTAGRRPRRSDPATPRSRDRRARRCARPSRGDRARPRARRSARRTA